MPAWNDILLELSAKDVRGTPITDADALRRKYLRAFYEMSNRNVIAYYSGFLTRFSERSNIDDNDMNGFMNAVHGLDKAKGLDLILHTPGGTISSACAIVDYLRSVFNKDIRCFVPQEAMSAGTMIACSCKSIFMGKHSSIGPIDPQFGAMSTGDVIEEAMKAKTEMSKDRGSIPYWTALLAKYPPAFIGKCEKAVQFAVENVKKWLAENMFDEDSDKQGKIDAIVNGLYDHSLTKQHDKHITIDEAQKLGLHIEALEDTPELQDVLLSIHHTYMLTFSGNAKVAKIIENHENKTMVLFHS